MPEGLWVDAERAIAGWGDRRLDLSAQEVAMLAALLHARGRVVARGELARRVGLSAVSGRRCDGILVGLRRALGDEAVCNVRGRGWRLAPLGSAAQAAP
ncbi:MAG: winged helix-turn-helix domain-containing protein [Acidimicrobiales bacterium]